MEKTEIKEHKIKKRKGKKYIVTCSRARG